MSRVFLPAALLALTVSAAALPAAAQGHWRMPVNRIEHQQDRINNGVADGQLTMREYNNLQSRLQTTTMIRRRDLQASDGTLTAQQRANLTQRLNTESHRIFFDNHNAAEQPGADRAAQSGTQTAAKTPQSGGSFGPIGNRVENQRDRIAQGVSSGQLTQREADTVRDRLQKINETRRDWLKANGGHLTEAQERELNFRLNHVSDAIYFDKHNLWDQPGT